MPYPKLPFPPAGPMEERERIEISIKELHSRISRSVFKIGGMLVHLRSEIIPRGEWRAYMGASQEHFGFSTATGFRYIEQYEEALRIPETKRAALEKEGLDPAKPRVLAAVQSISESLGDRVTPNVFATAVSRLVSAPRRAARAEVISKPSRQRKQTRLFNFIMHLFHMMSIEEIQAEVDAVMVKVELAVKKAA